MWQEVNDNTKEGKEGRGARLFILAFLALLYLVVEVLVFLFLGELEVFLNCLKGVTSREGEVEGEGRSCSDSADNWQSPLDDELSSRRGVLRVVGVGSRGRSVESRTSSNKDTTEHSFKGG